MGLIGIMALWLGLMKIAEDYTEGDLEKAFDLYQKLNDSKAEWATQADKEAAKKKAAQSASWNRGGGWKVTWYVKGSSWESIKANMK